MRSVVSRPWGRRGGQDAVALTDTRVDNKETNKHTIALHSACVTRAHSSGIARLQNPSGVSASAGAPGRRLTGPTRRACWASSCADTVPTSSSARKNDRCPSVKCDGACSRCDSATEVADAEEEGRAPGAKEERLDEATGDTSEDGGLGAGTGAIEEEGGSGAADDAAIGEDGGDDDAEFDRDSAWRLSGDRDRRRFATLSDDSGARSRGVRSRTDGWRRSTEGLSVGRVELDDATSSSTRSSASWATARTLRVQARLTTPST